MEKASLAVDMGQLRAQDLTMKTWENLFDRLEDKKPCGLWGTLSPNGPQRHLTQFENLRGLTYD